jgi:ubiquinone/menaquinone biosynthesis C-methylase UbiE
MCGAWKHDADIMGLILPVVRQVRANVLGRWYGYLATLLLTSPIICLNYGYVPAVPMDTPGLSASQEPMRHYLQLYAYVVQALDAEGKDLLEISCGYGGGAAFVNNRRRPRSYIGLDLTEAPLRKARNRFPSANLAFMAGSAESLGLAPQSFDAVISIEASHCYPSMPEFLNEVYRVLRPGGHLVLADYRPVSAMDHLKREIASSGLCLIDERDITSNVLRSLDETHEQRSQWIAHYGPFWLRPIMGQLAGVRGSIVYRGFLTRRLVYQRLLLTKS